MVPPLQAGVPELPQSESDAPTSLGFLDPGTTSGHLGCIMLRTLQAGADELPPSQPGAAESEALSVSPLRLGLESLSSLISTWIHRPLSDHAWSCWSLSSLYFGAASDHLELRYDTYILRSLEPRILFLSTLDPKGSLQLSQEPPNAYSLSLDLLSSPGPRLELPRTEVSLPQPEANEFSKILI